MSILNYFIKATKSFFGSGFTVQLSSVLPTFRVVYYAGKPIEKYVLLLQIVAIFILFCRGQFENTYYRTVIGALEFFRHQEWPMITIDF